MKVSRHVVSLLLPLVAACASSGDTLLPSGIEGRTGEVAMVDAASAPVVLSTERVPGRLSEYELSIWEDAAFQKRFMDSYISETEIEPGLTQYELEDMQDVLDLINDERIDDAVEMLEDMRDDTASAVIDFTLANIWFQQDELDGAAEAYDVAVKKFPNFRRAWRNLGIIHVRRGDFGPAAQAFTRVIELGGSDSVTYGLLGFAYGNVDNHISSETAYRMAVLLDPKTLDWKLGLARAYFKQGRFLDAVALCEVLIKDDPDQTDFWMLQANAYVGLNQPLKAVENFELVEYLGGATRDSHNMVGDIYVNQELYDLAVAAYIKAMESDESAAPDRAIQAAKVLTARGAHPEAKLIIARIQDVHGEGLELEPKKDLLKLQARLAVAEGKGDDEVRVLEEIVALDPLDGDALLLLGQHAARTDNPEKAVYYYERAANLEDFEADAKVRHAQLLVGQSKYTEALTLLRRAQQLEPREHIQDYLEQVERVASGR